MIFFVFHICGVHDIDIDSVADKTPDRLRSVIAEVYLGVHPDL
jgi:hypothetical protein